VLLEKPGCHLCEQVEAELRSGNAGAAGFTVVNIEGSRELHDEYWVRIPVVLVGGVVVFDARMMDVEGEWRKTLRRLLGSP